MGSELPSFEDFAKFKGLCRNLIQNPKDLESLRLLNSLLDGSPETFIKVIQPSVLSTFYPVLKSISEDKKSFSDNEKQLIVDTFKILFKKSVIDKLGLFFNIYSFLLFEIYDHLQHKILPIQEEYKLSIMDCTTSMAQSVSSELIFELYTKENAPKLCQMLYVAIELAKTEKMKSLKIAAMNCIMALARVLDEHEFQDIVIRKQVSEVFLFFLPGIASGLKKIALEDEKIGHKVPMIALKVWGRIITLLMQDYTNSTTQVVFNVEESGGLKPKPDGKKLKENVNSEIFTKNFKKQKFKDNNEIKSYLKSSKITPQWYKDTDSKLYPLVVEFTKLVHHAHFKVRSELCSTCELIINHCLTTMPRSGSLLIEIVIALTEDEDETISEQSSNILKKLSTQLSSDSFKSLLESLEEGFYNGINRLPRKFNSVDEREQLSSLNLLIGYLNLFGKHKLNQVLLSGDHLKKLLQTLIHISELEKCSTGLFEEYSIKDLDLSSESKPLWKNFHYFREDSVTLKLGKLCSLLGQYETFKLVSDFLLDVLLYEPEHRKEAIFILNEVMSGVIYSPSTHEIIKDILNTYIDGTYWQVPLAVSIDEQGYEHTLVEVQHNAIQVCLLVEGIGNISVLLKENFKEFLFKILYLILEKAGNNHSLVRAAGLLALKNITSSCGYLHVTDLITNNIDYFSYHVERRLNKPGDKENVLNVFFVVLNYSTVDVLNYVADIVQEVLVLSCDRFKADYATAFLEVFKIFIRRLWKWYNIEVTVPPVKSKAQQLLEVEEFQVSGIENENELPDEMKKSSEELFKEDLLKSQEEVEEPEVEGYKKPDPPLHIKITVAILMRSLHFLPSKDRTRKLLVLEILSMGLEVIRDWEDELLPIVHQIWSPLVERFKEYNNPLIINYSFQLLIVLARVSKDFIRMRTTKEVLPSIVEILQKLSTESYLKDKGSAYRYSQKYKLQLMVLENLGRILVDLDVQDKIIQNTSDTLLKYLSDNQPVPLQNATLGLFKIIAQYDPELVISKIAMWNTAHTNDEFSKNLLQLNCIIKEIKC